jgi:hypothetical protein
MSQNNPLTLVSFDIDGTLEVGDPPGRLDLDLVRHALRLGYVVGSCSDRTIRNQQEIWADAQIEVHFTALKHRLDDVRERFEARRYVHIGDTDVDRHFAVRAGFEFCHVDDVPPQGTEGWIF